MERATGFELEVKKDSKILQTSLISPWKKARFTGKKNIISKEFIITDKRLNSNSNLNISIFLVSVKQTCFVRTIVMYFYYSSQEVW